MSNMVRQTGLLVSALALVSLALAADDKKDAEQPSPKEKLETKEKVMSAGEVTGKVIKVEGEQKRFTLRVEFLELNQQALAQHQLNLARRRQDILRNPNPVDRQRQLQQLAVDAQRPPANLYQKGHKDVELQAADEIKVRQSQPPVDFDEKGRPKKYTAQELKELKGPGNLPGFPAEFDSLKADQVVKVYLAKRKDAPRGQGKDKDKDRDLFGDNKFGDNKPQVTMVVILGEVPK
jgi:hypothetical protein